MAFFAFAQAASARASAQTAADAAALAAAQEARDELMDGLERAIADDEDWLVWLDARRANGTGASAAAQALATANSAALVKGAEPTVINGYAGFYVRVRAEASVGDTVLPGTEGMHAEAEAIAVIRPRCEFDAAADPADTVELLCEDGPIDVDPETFEPGDLNGPELFSVSLAQ